MTCRPTTGPQQLRGLPVRIGSPSPAGASLRGSRRRTRTRDEIEDRERPARRPAHLRRLGRANAGQLLGVRHEVHGLHDAVVDVGGERRDRLAPGGGHDPRSAVDLRKVDAQVGRRPAPDRLRESGRPLLARDGDQGPAIFCPPRPGPPARAVALAFLGALEGIMIALALTGLDPLAVPRH